VKADIRGKIQDFKGFQNKEQLAEAGSKLNEVVATQEEKVTALNALITKLNTVLDKAKAFAEANKDKIAQYSKIKEEYKALVQSIQDNHKNIVQLNSDIRGLINKIVATVSANQDSFSDEQKATLNTILTELKAIKDNLKAKLKFGEVKTAIENANKFRKEGKFEEAKAELQKAITVQNERITLLTDTKVKIEKVLADINILVASSTTSSEPVSSDVASAA
jgi:ABC-type transporter Mla subunit MlaD